MAATIATAEACAINGPGTDLLCGALQQRFDVFGARPGIATLELNGLTDTGRCADREGAGTRINADKVADKEIAAMKFIEVLVNDESDKQISAQAAFFGFRERVQGLHEDFIRRAIADLMDVMAFGARNGP